MSTKANAILYLALISTAFSFERSMAEEGCETSEFECADGGCMLKEFFCDGTPDCSDRSDELSATEDGIQCRSVNSNKTCRLPEDQGHMFDVLCKTELQCKSFEMTCVDGSYCVHYEAFCDGENNCRDGSDEVTYRENHTEEDGVKCRSTKRLRNFCLLPAKQKEKEQNVCRQDTSCRFDEFKCTDGSACVFKDLFCNEAADCDDRSDEIDYDAAVHSKIGVRCRKREKLQEFCMLPKSMQNRKRSFCNVDAVCHKPDMFRCLDHSACVYASHFCDGVPHCRDGSDEVIFDSANQTNGVPCLHKYYPHERTCLLPYPQDSKFSNLCLPDCDEDEFTCDDKSACLKKRRFCDGKYDCRDGSDEKRYSFTLHQSVGIPCGGRAAYGCLLPYKYVCDGHLHCSDGTDECLCGNNNTRFEQPYSDDKCQRCMDGSLIFPLKNKCDLSIDCEDLSDECLCGGDSDLEGFSQICSRVDWGGRMNTSKRSFECEEGGDQYAIDKLCDRSVDCHNGFDEREDICKNTKAYANANLNSGIQHDSYTCLWSGQSAWKCDGRPECEYMDDECEGCPNPPDFCQFVTKRIIFDCVDADFLEGYRVCNAIPDCQDGRDENYCPDKFYCETADPVHIPKEKKCDLVWDCNDWSDELYCQNHTLGDCDSDEGNTGSSCKHTHFYCDDWDLSEFLDSKKVCDGNVDCKSGADECQNCTEGIFSNDDYLISTKPLIPFLWLISICALGGNVFVIMHSIKSLAMEYSRLSKIEKTQNILVLNLSMADLLVGIYTMSICILNNILSASKYCLRDHEWRSSPTCSALGALLVIGSEESVFALTIITAYRLDSVCRPFSRTSIRSVCVLMVFSWALSIGLGVLPLAPSAGDYFVESIWYRENSFVSKLDLEEVEHFTERLQTMQRDNPNFTNTEGTFGSWALVEGLINNLNPDYVPDRRFGYYSNHGVCLPRIFPDMTKDKSWAFSLFFIVINFFSFIFIFAGYVILYLKATKTGVAVGSNAKRAEKLQKKVTRIVVTDFFCWIPVCIMAFLQLSGKDIPMEVYVPVGMILIPINSAINPFLYSGAPEFLAERLSPLWAQLRFRVRRSWLHFRERHEEAESLQLQNYRQGTDSTSDSNRRGTASTSAGPMRTTSAASA